MHRDVEHWYIGYICQALDDSKLHYHHCRTWFRLFPDDRENTYSIEGVKNNNNENEVVVYKGWTIDWRHNTNAPIVFRGSLDGFKNWLNANKTQPQIESEEISNGICFTTPEVCQSKIDKMRALLNEFVDAANIQFPIEDDDSKQFKHYTVNQIQDTLRILDGEIQNLQNDLNEYNKKARKKHMRKARYFDDFVADCPYFNGGADVNNGYGCDHPDQEEKENGQGKCYCWSCPRGCPADEESLEEDDIEWPDGKPDPEDIGEDYYIIENE